mmetsp:Transcript_61142/g.139863  ORF Transcript_61142/g.139863 Transcript_61142/m.139863 type:complete len:344 (+) Transcript_61142:205-1236(+)
MLLENDISVVSCPVAPAQLLADSDPLLGDLLLERPLLLPELEQLLQLKPRLARPPVAAIDGAEDFGVALLDVQRLVLGHAPLLQQRPRALELLERRLAVGDDPVEGHAWKRRGGWRCFEKLCESLHPCEECVEEGGLAIVHLFAFRLERQVLLLVMLEAVVGREGVNASSSNDSGSRVECPCDALLFRRRRLALLPVHIPPRQHLLEEGEVGREGREEVSREGVKRRELLVVLELLQELDTSVAHLVVFAVRIRLVLVLLLLLLLDFLLLGDHARDVALVFGPNLRPDHLENAGEEVARLGARNLIDRRRDEERLARALSHRRARVLVAGRQRRLQRGVHARR